MLLLVYVCSVIRHKHPSFFLINENWWLGQQKWHLFGYIYNQTVFIQSNQRQNIPFLYLKIPRLHAHQTDFADNRSLKRVSQVKTIFCH